MALGRRVALLASTLVLGGCFLDYDKLSSVLDGGAGVAHCGNGMLDGDERDVDCGGSCGLCGADRSCSQDTDCSTGSCVLGLCGRASSPPFWLTVTTMPTPRARIALATGPDGQLYAMGGTASGPNLTTVEAYSLESDQWSARAPMAYARYGFGATTGPDGKLYVFGGGTESVGGGSEFVEAYTPATNLWTSAPAPGHFDNTSAATATDGGIYAVYAYHDTSGSHYGAQVYRVPPVDRWDPLPALPGTASPLVTAGVDGRIYIPGNPALLSIAPGESAWRAEAPSQSGIGAIAAGADGLVYSISGWNPTKVEAYSPGARRWIDRPSLNESRTEFAATPGPDGRIYVAGGFGTMGALATIVAYGPLIELSSSSAQPGGGLTLTGKNFAANATVTVTIGSASVATGTTDANGALVAPLSFSAPTESGSYRVVAVDNRSVYPVSAPLVVP